MFARSANQTLSQKDKSAKRWLPSDGNVQFLG